VEILIGKGNGLDKISSLNLAHNDDSLEWSISTYDRTKFANREDLFSNANAYLATLDSETQDRVWECYLTIYEYLEVTDDPHKLQLILKRSVTELFGILNLTDMRHWCSYYGQFTYPTNLKDTYGDNNPRELTYLRSTYSELLFMATALRFMVPIWGEYIQRSKATVANVYKEYMAANILGESDIFKSPELSRLRAYVTACQKDVKTSLTAVMTGIGSVEQPEWLLAKVMVRRLAVAETAVHETSIISNLYMFVKSNIEGIDKLCGEKIREKHKPSDNGGEEDNASRVETYKVKQTIADSSAILISVYMEDYHRAATRLYPDIPSELVELCVSKLLNDGKLVILPFRLELASIIIEPIISVRSLESLEYPIQLRMMGICQAVLFHLGLDELAHLITATGKEIPTDVLRIDNVGGSRSRLTKENLEQLNILYPHWRKQGRNTERQKNDNVSMLFIEAFNKETQELDWLYCSPKSTLPPKAVNGRTYRIPTDLKNLLAKLTLTTK